mmetsp:Transcript_27747/g.27435  ORF Transcript_27747/g.27435 Transcript_27747/m.27435 type:complete len:902 (+) Transcript_27747:376-3081(+)
MMEQKINEKNLKNVFSVWLTDGQDNNGLASLTPVMEAFKNSLEAKGVSIAVHCIGFGSGHDATLLTKLSQSGTRPGTFQYVPEGGRIPVAVNNVYELAYESTTWARLVSQGGAVSYKVNVDKDGDEESKTPGLKALVYISENDLEDCKIEIHKGSNVVSVELEPTRGDSKNFFDLVDLVTRFISFKVSQALEQGTQGAGEKLRELCPLLDEMDRRLENLLQESKRLRPYKQKQLASFFSATKDLISFYFSTLGTIGGGEIGNETLAQLNGYANKVSLRKNLEKKIAKEAGPNLPLLFQADDQTEELMHDFERKELVERYPDFQRQGTCILSGKNWIDAVTSGDCLCLTFCVERPQNLEGNPLDIKITNISSAIISHDTFLESPLFETKAGQLIQGPRSYQHGQPTPSAHTLDPKLPHEPLNAVIPLFLSPEHWKIAKLRLNSMLAYDITVDVLGFKPDQLLYFPFMLLCKSFELNLPKISPETHSLIQETCRQIYLDNQDTMLKSLKDKVENYIAVAAIRLEDSIPSNQIFLSQLYIANLVGDITEFREILPFVFEEEVRRSFKYPETKFHELCIKLLKVDATKEIEAVKTSFVDKKSSFAQRFLVLLESVTGVKETEEVKKEEDAKQEEPVAVAQKHEFKERILELSAETNEAIDKLYSELQHQAFGAFSQLLSVLGLSVNTLEDLNLTENEQKLAFLLQVIGHHKILDRKEAINTNAYTNSFDKEASVAFIQNSYTAALNREVLSFKSQLIAQLEGKEAQQKALTFAMTDDLNEAAGLAHGLHQGDIGFPLFAKSLAMSHVPHVIEKAKMLVTGQYKGVKLIMDNLKLNPKFIEWKPKKKFTHKIYLAHKDNVRKEDWFEAFPHQRDHFEHVFMRSSGTFVPYTKPRSNCRDKRHFNKP